LKKKLLTLGIVFALLAALVIPASVAMAGGTTQTGGTVATVPEVDTVTPPTGTIDTTPTVVIAGTGFIQATEEASDVSFSGTGITVTEFNVDSPIQITAVLDIAANAPAGAGDVSVTVGGVVGTGTNVFTIAESFTLEAPSPINLLLMTVGIDNPGESFEDGTVVTNIVASWEVIVTDEKAAEKGYMNTDPSGSGTSLGVPFTISEAGVVYTSAVTGITYSGDPVTLPFYIKQAVAAEDLAGAYTITLTFTGSY